MKVSKVTIKQMGHLGAFEMYINGEMVGEVLSVSYRTSLDEPPTVTVRFHADPVDIILEDAEVVLLRPLHDHSHRR